MKKTLLIFTIFLTYQLNAQQTFQWGIKAGSEGTDVVNDMASIGNNIYVAGNFSGTFISEDKQTKGESLSDIFLIKLDQEGNTAWIRALSGKGSENSAKVAANENAIYMGGTISGSVKQGKNEYAGKGKALFLTSWNKQGKINWLIRIPFTGNATLDVLELNKDGSILAGGMLSGSLTFGDETISSKPGRKAYTFSLSPDGNFIDAEISEGRGDCRLLSVKYGEGGVRYLLFNTLGWMAFGKNTTVFNRDEKFKGLILLKETNGEANWVKYIRGEGYIQGVELNITEENGVLACFNYGQKVSLPDTVLNTSALQDVAIVSYNADGVQNWLRQLKSPVVCYAMDARQTRDKKLLITGYFRSGYTFGKESILAENDNSDESMFLLQINKDGRLSWNDQPGGQASAFGKSVVIGNHGDIYIAGGFKNELSFNAEIMKSAGKEDVLVAKYFNCAQLSVSIDEPDALCKGETVELSVSGNNFENFFWNDSVWGETLVANNPGIYFVEAFNNKGCSTRDTIELKWAGTNKLGLPEKVAISPGDEVMLIANDGYANYFWGDGTIGPEHSVEYNSNIDSLAFIVSAETFEGCTETDTTIARFLSDSNLHRKYIVSSLEVYPNPVTDNLSWYFKTEKSQDILVKLFDGKGVLVYSNEINSYIPNSAQHIDMGGMASGNYLLTLTIGENKLNKKIVKK